VRNKVYWQSVSVLGREKKSLLLLAGIGSLKFIQNPYHLQETYEKVLNTERPM
jgi:hypothetical protein